MEEGAEATGTLVPWTALPACPNLSLKPKPKPELNKKVTHCGDLRGTSTLPKVFDQPNGSKLELVWKGRQPVGPKKHPSLFSESLGVLMVTSRRFDWTKNWELQDVGDKEWLWDNIKDKWELDETWKEPTLGLIFGDEFKNKKSKWKMNFYSRYATYESIISHRRATIMAANRAKQITKHAAGRISFHQFGKITDKMKDLAGIDEHGTQLPLSDEIYREVMPPEWHGRVRLNGRGVTPTNYFGSLLSLDNRVNDLESQLAEMQRVVQEKEEERRLEIEEIKRQAQEKDEQRRHEIDEMKRQLDARDADMEARLMQKVVKFAKMVSHISGSGLELKIKYLQL
ncbi:hypothetical protein IFM89_023352 [Coptis chinensis]|uniref:Uncharacterized protein n=2 Tax=Coptis chinensis TaxID=261450 RepID=A0A835HF15_9MAGN|nr:hypothetical protein IFM89_023352 [Coptis chinensis]